MTPDLMQHFGLLSIVMAFVLGLYALKRWPMDASKSFSINIAQKKESRVLFGFAFTAITLLFYSFQFGWLLPLIGGGASIWTVSIAACILQLMIGVFPATDGVSLRIHNFAAYAMIAVLTVFVLMLMIDYDLSTPAITAGVIALTYWFSMVALWPFVKAVKDNALWAQAGFFLTFWSFILVLTYS